MPRFSAFTPFGMLAFSGKPSHAENIFRSLQKATGNGKNYSTDPGGLINGRLYGWAMGMGRARYALQRAGNQSDPLRVTDMLPREEASYGLAPRRSASLRERREALAVKVKLTRGATRENIEDGLRSLLGSDFVAYVTQTPGSANFTPAIVDIEKTGTFKKAKSRIKLAKLTNSVSAGVPGSVTFAYSHLEGDSAALRVGETVVIDPGVNGLREAVTITAVGSGTATAVVTKAHAANALITTAPFPFWLSDQRVDVVVVTAEAVLDAEARRKVNEFLRRVLRCVSVWFVTEPSGSGTAGPFKVGVGKLGVTPIGAVTY